MNLSLFLNKYTGQKVDFDNAFGFQCVDLFRQYTKDVLNAPHTGAVEGAKDLFLNYLNLPLEQKYYKKVSTNFPEAGDVCIWNGTPSNKYGHVAICINRISDTKILVFEQNGITQDGAKFSIRSNINLLGVLRPLTSVI